MIRSTIYARHERRLLSREAARRQRWQEEQDDAASHVETKEAPEVSRSEDEVSTMASASASAATPGIISDASFSTMGTLASSTDFPSSTGFSSTTSIVYSDVPSERDGSSSYHHHQAQQQPKSNAKGSTLLLAASAAATSAWAFSRSARVSRPFHTPFVNASLRAAGTSCSTATATTSASGGSRQVALLAGACMAAGGHCCPISSPFRAGARLPAAVKMSVLGAMSFFVGGRYASRLHQQQHY